MTQSGRSDTLGDLAVALVTVWLVAQLVKPSAAERRRRWEDAFYAGVGRAVLSDLDKGDSE